MEPVRLQEILALLYAATSIEDDTVWQENNAVLSSLPAYCGQCDNFGHNASDCQFFHGRERAEAAFTPHVHHTYGHYTFRRLGRNEAQERVIEVNGKSWVVKRATGDDNNCLLDTLRQMLKPDGIVLYEGYLQRVRHDLAKGDYAAEGEFQVRDSTHPGGANFLEFLEHTHAAVRLLDMHRAQVH